MPAPASESENYKMLFTILDHLEAKGELQGKVSWPAIAAAMGIDKVNTLQKRWGTLKKAQGLGQGFDGKGAIANGTANGAANGSGDGPVAKPTPKKRATKAANDDESPKKKSKATPKKAVKSKAVVEEDDGEGEDDGDQA